MSVLTTSKNKRKVRFSLPLSLSLLQLRCLHRTHQLSLALHLPLSLMLRRAYGQELSRMLAHSLTHISRSLLSSIWHALSHTYTWHPYYLADLARQAHLLATSAWATLLLSKSTYTRTNFLPFWHPLSSLSLVFLHPSHFLSHFSHISKAAAHSLKPQIADSK